MEIQLPSFALIFTFLLFLLTFVKYLNYSKTQGPIPKLPPGPWKLPLIGNLHQLIGALPHHCLRGLAQKYGPVMHLQLGEVSAVVISSAEAAKEVMKIHDIIFATRPELTFGKILSYNCTDIAFAPYGNYWRQLRKICIMELLNAKRVQSFKSVREEEVHSFIKSISSSPVGIPINLSQKILSLTNCIVSRAAFGKKCNNKDEFIMLTMELVKLAGGFEVPDLFPSLKFLHSISKTKAKLEEVHLKIDKILGEIINEHKLKRKSTTISGDKIGKEDLVDVLLRLQESGDLEVPITIDNIKAVIWDMVSAGTETSASTIEWAMSEMIKNPKVMAQAQAEVRQVLKGKGKIEETDIQELIYLKLVIKETLRLHPALPLLLPREARERCKINGYEVPTKTNVIVNAWAIGRDPIYWTNAECFEPERFHGSSVDFRGTYFEFLPFGAGRRICPGISLAIANIELPLAHLLYHFDWKLANGKMSEELDMTEVFGFVSRKRKELQLLSTPCIPLIHENCEKDGKK